MFLSSKKYALLMMLALTSNASYAGFYMNTPAMEKPKVAAKSKIEKDVAIDDEEEKPVRHSKREWQEMSKKSDDKKPSKNSKEAANKVATEVIAPSVVKPLQTFVLDENDATLSVAVGRWCAQSNGECRMIKWKSDLDSPLEAGGIFNAPNAKDAINQLLNNIAKTTGHTFELDTHYQNNVWIVSDKIN